MVEPTAQPSNRPLVSVILPAHNGEATIGYTLDSLARQHYAPLEWIIIDDGSRDGTARIVEAFLRKRSFPARLVRHESNLGLSKTLNHGLRDARGELVLTLHQDIVLDGPDWISRAVEDLARNPSVSVVTADYGIPDLHEVDFVQRVFGILRRQFHYHPPEGFEFATFTEFKCDIARRSALEKIGGFPERFRVAGEDLWVAYTLRASGQQIMKDFRLRSVQRFTGAATTVTGNLGKEFLFGRVFAGILRTFGSLPTRGLAGSASSRSRAWNRASQPLVLLAGLVFLALVLVTRNPWFLVALGGLVLARLVYYTARLYPDLKRFLHRSGRALGESILGSALGFLSDFAYSLGLGEGLILWSLGRRL
ncbi:MAG: glycosyltransferase family 2 protein [Thermoplasmata archaeon]